jgi:potassium channel subfamily K
MTENSALLLKNVSKQGYTKERHAAFDTPKDPVLRAPESMLPIRVLIYLVGYLLIGAVTYRHVEGINYLEGLYLSVITFTTVGYGDFAPKDDRGRIFTCFFIALAMMGVAQLVDFVFDYVVEQRKRLEQQVIFTSWFKDDDDDSEGSDGAADHVPIALEVIDDAVHEANLRKEQRWELIYSFFTSAVIMLSVIMVGVIGFSLVVDDYNFIESFYLSTMTVTTVGYGDIVPQNDASRAFTGFYAIFGTIAFGRAVGYFIETVATQRENEKHRKLLSSSALDYDTWNMANADGSPDVSKVEFVYMRLLQMGLVDDNVRMAIEKQFERMDIDHDGGLTIDDIVKAQEMHVSKKKSSKSRKMSRKSGKRSQKHTS